MNYLKISGQLVCKMLVLLAFAFAACSDELSGGVTEETRVYALSGRVGDVYPIFGVVKKNETSEDSLAFGNKVLAKKGSIVSVYELDASTFAETGHVFVDTVGDEGQFSFDSLFLNSPYVLITTQERYRSSLEAHWGDDDRVDTIYAYRDARKAIVDLRKISEVSVNVLTNLKVPFMLDYFAEGKSFEEANRLAERAVLEEYGVYEDLGPFEALSDSVTELSYVVCLMNNIRYDYDSTLFIYISAGAFFSSTDENLNLSSEEGQAYLSAVKMAKYIVGYYARQNGLGQCVESRENEMHTVLNYMGPYSVVCRSGKWVLGFNKIDYTSGIMTDSRDGKTYKTVTYNWGNVSQTWMAENILGDTTWNVAMDVEDTVGLDLSNHQGVCPDGWRIPTLNDWHVLLQNMGEQYGVAYDKVVPALYDEPATGFGLHSVPDLPFFDLEYSECREYCSIEVIFGYFMNYFIVADTSMSVIEFFDSTVLYGFDFSMDQKGYHRLSADDKKGARHRSYGAVRCIKN